MLGDGYQFDFVEGNHPWPAAPGIREVFGNNQICFSYSDGSAESTREAVSDLADYIIANGPFPCVLGFSMGASLLATLLLSADARSAANQIKSAIFLSGTAPCDWDELQKGRIRFLNGKDVPRQDAIRTPTLHAWSAFDLDYPGQSCQLVQACKEDNRKEIMHSAGHAIPIADHEITNIAAAIRELIIGTLGAANVG